MPPPACPRQDRGSGEEFPDARTALARAWASLPERLRGPTQFLGRQYAGCAATIGVMPRCDFTCSGCYLGTDANRLAPRPLAEVKAQLRAIRAWLGPAGNLQLTDGEVTLRDPAELIELIAYARAIGLVPMLMTHGETFRRKPGLLERLMCEGGLTEISLHVDATMKGRRDEYARASSERALDGLRAELADLIRAARRRTRRRLEAASTVTVTRATLDDVPGTVRWFLANADAFKMVSFQPLARVGRTDPALEGVSADELWERIAAGAGDAAIRRGEGHLGHPACSRFVQGLVTRPRVRRAARPIPTGTAAAPAFVPLYRRDDEEEMRLLGELLDRFGGTSFRLDEGAIKVRRMLALVARHGGFLMLRLIPHVLRLLRRARTLRPRYFCIVSHHFMSAPELATDLGRERLASCAFRVPIDGSLESMCAVNALGLRDAFHRGKQATPSLRVSADRPGAT